jgi:hypothetical protein
MIANEITVITSHAPSRVCKSYRLNEIGEVEKSTIACITYGIAKTVIVETAADMVSLLSEITSSHNMVIVPGVFQNAPSQGGEFKIVTESALSKMIGDIPQKDVPGGVQEVDGNLVAARLKRGIRNSCWVLFDADSPEGMPSEWAGWTIDERLRAFETILPGISTCERIELRGSSARVDKGGGPGPATHAWIRMVDSTKLETLYAYVRVEMVIRELSFEFKKRSTKDREKTVGLEPRTLFDLAVWHIGRLVFCAKPDVPIEGCTVADADIKIINRGAGDYDNRWLNIPTVTALAALREKSPGTFIRIKQHADGGILFTDVGTLTDSTDIEAGGEFRTFDEWVQGMRPGEKLRCETPFRESSSEAAFIRKPTYGHPFLYDIGSGIKYLRKFEFEQLKTIPALFIGKLKLLSIELDKTERELSEDIELDFQLLQQIINSTGYHQINGKFTLLDPSGDFRLFTKQDVVAGILNSCGAFYNRRKLDEIIKHTAGVRFAGDRRAYKDFIATTTPILNKALTSHILIERQYGNVAMRVDMFNSQPIVRINEGCATFVFPHVPLKEGIIDPAIVADYKEHWPELDRFLELMVAARFAAARKKAYLWLKCPSDWGKGALEAILSAHGLVVSMQPTELEKLFAGHPVGRQMADFKRSWVLAFNEFKSAKAELKMLEQSMSFAPKNMPICKVDLYLKLMTSAEQVDSLGSDDTGVEDQFANRFSLMRPIGNLDTRPLFQKSKANYLATMTAYVGQFVNKLVAEYVKLGYRSAADQGDRTVGMFHTEFGIDNTYERVGDKLPQFSKDFVEWVISEYKSARSQKYNGNHRLSRAEQSVFDNAHVKRDANGVEELYIKRPSELVKIWLDISFNQSERGKLQWKTGDILRILPPCLNTRFGDNQAKVIYIGRLPSCEGTDDMEGDLTDLRIDDASDLL